MRIRKIDHAVLVSDIFALDIRTAPALVAQTRAALSSGVQEVEQVDFDLSQTDNVDSTGLGALVALFRSVRTRAGRAVPFRLLNPAPPAQQLIELTRLHHLFHVVHDNHLPASRV
jgi:anti-anti-sigma factor